MNHYIRHLFLVVFVIVAVSHADKQETSVVANNKQPKTDLSRTKRDYASESGGLERLDGQIHYLLGAIPEKIETAKAAIEAGIQDTLIKRVTQGWAIVVGSWKDIASDWVINNRTFNNFGGDATLYSYGFLATYGIGFGFPLLLGLPEKNLDCDSYDFHALVQQYGLDGGIGGYYDSAYKGNNLILPSQIKEFELISQAKLCCILKEESNYLEAAEVKWALDELIAALNVRSSWSGGY